MIIPSKKIYILISKNIILYQEKNNIFLFKKIGQNPFLSIVLSKHGLLFHRKKKFRMYERCHSDLFHKKDHNVEVVVYIISA